MVQNSDSQNLISQFYISIEINDQNTANLKEEWLGIF